MALPSDSKARHSWPDLTLFPWKHSRANQEAGNATSATREKCASKIPQEFNTSAAQGKTVVQRLSQPN